MLNLLDIDVEGMAGRAPQWTRKPVIMVELTPPEQG